jgi:transcription elongation factor
MTPDIYMMKTISNTADRLVRELKLLFSYPEEPNLISYDEVIQELNRRRRKLNLARVAQFTPSAKPFCPQPYVAISTSAAASSTTSYDYEPPDDFCAEELRGYHP